MKNQSFGALIFKVMFVFAITLIGYVVITTYIDENNLDYSVLKNSVSCGDYQCAVNTDKTLNGEFLKYENDLMYFTYDKQIFTTRLAFVVLNEDAEQYINQILQEGSKIQINPVYIAQGSYVSYVHYTVDNKSYFVQEVLLKKNLVKSVNVFELNKKEKSYALLESEALEKSLNFDDSDIYQAFSSQNNDSVQLVKSFDKDSSTGNINIVDSENSLIKGISDYVNSLGKQNSSTVINENVDTKISSNDVNLSVDACDLNGNRNANAIVDIGFDSDYATRDYFAMTNEYGQLIYVYASEIIVQNDKKEDVTSSGRYCRDEAKVKGTESKDLDEGHAIADSLGGVANAYNITPQDSTLNRSGKQFKLEENIRDAAYSGDEVTEFQYFIEYPNTETQTPSKYYGSYMLNGKEKTFSFENK